LLVKFPFVEGNNVHLSFISDDFEEIRSVFNKLGDGYLDEETKR